MARGPKPQPASVKALKAPVRSTSKPKAEVAATEVVPDGKGHPPAWLKGGARELWNKLAPVMRSAHLLRATDEQAFARYCRNFDRWVKLRDQLDKRGYTYDAETTTGGKLRRADPNFLIADRLERQLLATEDRFGLNPAERQRLVAARANAPGGDLFDAPAAARADDPAVAPAAPTEPVDAPVGFLN